MRAPITVVIPTLNASAGLPGTLASLTPGLEAGLIRELVISDGGSTDESRGIAEAAGAIWVAGPAGRGGQLRRGAQAAGGEWLLFLHADTRLDPYWAEVVKGQMARLRPAVFRLRFDARGMAPRLVAGWANLRTRLFGLPYGDQGLLIPRADYVAMGGFADIPLMEDVAMARTLRRRFDMMTCHAQTSAERYQRDGWLRRGARNLWVLGRYLAGADPERLVAPYKQGGREAR